MKRAHEQTGFSLVEVIVVMAIISLITSVILAYLTTSHDKAVLVSQQQTASTIDHGVGDQYVGSWNFNDCTATTAIDNSGNKNSATLQGATWSSDSPWGSGCAVSFTREHYVHIAAANMPVQSAVRTVTLWLKLEEENATVPLFSFGQGDCTSKMFSLKLAEGKLQFYGGCNNHTSTIVIPPKKWTFVSLTYNGTDSIKLSANGQSETFTVGELDTQLSELFIGAETVNNGGSFRSYYKGTIDNVHIFSAKI